MIFSPSQISVIPIQCLNRQKRHMVYLFFQKKRYVVKMESTFSLLNLSRDTPIKPQTPDFFGMLTQFTKKFRLSDTLPDHRSTARTAGGSESEWGANDPLAFTCFFYPSSNSVPSHAQKPNISPHNRLKTCFAIRAAPRL